MFFVNAKNKWSKLRVEDQLGKYSRPSIDFFVFIVLSSAIATLGISLNNISVIIGAMVVAPLITPVFGFSLSLLVLRIKSLVNAFSAIVLGSILAIFVSALVSILIKSSYEAVDVQSVLPVLDNTFPLFF